MAGATLRLAIRDGDQEVDVWNISGLLADNDLELVIAEAGGDTAVSRNFAEAILAELRQFDSFPGSLIEISAAKASPVKSTISRSLLVALSSDGVDWVERPWQKQWLVQDEDLALPALPLADVQNTPRIFSGRLGRINAVFWRKSVTEIVPTVLARLGLAAERPRIFISYRRHEAQALADQLFTALAERNFDVFLDCFRVAPGVDFQNRLRQELGDKSVVLVLESKGILESQWTQYEIDTAKSHMLGLMALNLPGGVAVSAIDESRRIRLSGGDLQGGPGASAHVVAVRLPALLTEIIAEHDRALRRRLSILRLSVVEALTDDGWTVEPLGGVLVTAMDRKKRSWRILVCARPPELSDFHTVCRYLDASVGSRAVVIGLTALLEPVSTAPLIWLAKVSNLPLFDTAELTTLSARLGAI